MPPLIVAAFILYDALYENESEAYYFKVMGPFTLIGHKGDLSL